MFADINVAILLKSVLLQLNLLLNQGLLALEPSLHHIFVSLGPGHNRLQILLDLVNAPLI
jgi:hypothetical protein